MAPEEGLLALREAAAQKKKVEQHKEMLSRTEVLDWLIANLPEGGPGHNRQPITQDDVREIKKAVAALKALPVVPKDSDKNRAKDVAWILKKIGERLGTYLDTFLLEAAKSAGKRLPHWLAIWFALHNLVPSIFNWLS
jgi:hypothetical protein